MAMKPLARYGSLANFVQLTRSLRLDPNLLMRSVGLDPGGVAVQDRWVPAEAIIELLELTADQAHKPDLGLRLAELRRLSHLGPLSLVLREEPDVRSALTLLARHERMYNESLRTLVTVHDGVADIRVELDVGHPIADRQSTDLAVGVLFSLIRELAGDSWRPLSVSFAHPPPEDDTTARRIFGGLARYHRDFNGLTVAEADLDRPVSQSDPQLREYSRRILSELDPGAAPSTTVRTRELVEMLLPTGRCTVDQVASSLGVDRRTVHRRLAAEGASYSSVVDDTRAALAEHLVAAQRYSFTDVAMMLGFSSPSNFSRWFRGRFDCTPRQWRTARAARSPDSPPHGDLPLD
ncbi:AraC family transcriptional regulator [Gordonia alkaliphila]|uniref:AraC family transcriptional regulator n=2 Tax=Gordonia alkaliphila TaxID=1053547 RepID=A0ABP8Z889_9ACTN